MSSLIAIIDTDKDISMSSDPPTEQNTNYGTQAGSKQETVIASIICGIVLLVPMIFIEHEYDLFTKEYGEAKEGAAGSALALAVVFRTVSRTVLRTIVRTSARAGMRASLKGAMRAGIRAASRSSAKNLTNESMQNSDEESSSSSNNIKSLLFASGLLYASWIIVVGLGQPFENLLESSAARQKAIIEKRMEEEKIKEFQGLAIYAFQKEEQLKKEKQHFEDLRANLKKERDAQKQQELQKDLQIQHETVAFTTNEYENALRDSNGIKLNPNEIKKEEAETELSKTLDWLYTYAPFPGKTSYDSLLIWLGGIIMFLPLWVIFFVQSFWAKREGKELILETGPIGGVIQLYFAGAFSFMPLTSDVIVPDASAATRGRIATIGLLVPTILAAILWYLWKTTNSIHPQILFAADAFLIYPMVQCFPLAPLEGIYIWRWNKTLWFFFFVLIMSMFMLMASEALRGII